MNNVCFVCLNKCKEEEKLLFVRCDCAKCGKYAYEKNFVTSYEYYKSAFDIKKVQKLEQTIKKLIKKGNVCFVDDAETSLVEGYKLLEFRDILNIAGLDLAHNNTIDSNWKD